MILYHTTDAAEVILVNGFRDAEGSYMFANLTLRGVFLAKTPANVNDGAKGEDVLEVKFPDDVDLEEYAIVEEGRPAWEWCVPAEVINGQATVRLMTEQEVDTL